MSRVRLRHDSQYDGSPRLARMGCTPQSTANALRSTTGGQFDLTGDNMLALLPLSEETNPLTPGWSLIDARNAVAKLAGAPELFVRNTFWVSVENALAAGYAVILQGDSDVFPNGCSGTFDGLHCVDVVDGWLGDPICPDWRQEDMALVKAYAEKFPGELISWAQFAIPVPEEPVVSKGYTFKDSNLRGWLRNVQPGQTYIDPRDDSVSPLAPLVDPGYRVVAYVLYPSGNPNSVAAFLVDTGNPILVIDNGLQTFVADTASPVDEAAVRKDQRRLDHDEIGKREADRLLPLS